MISSTSSLFSKRKAEEEADAAIKNQHDLTSVCRHLLKKKPEILRCGHELWLNETKINEDLDGMELKLRIHGYDDRASRFKYLRHILKLKWKDKSNSYIALMKFLTEMSTNPTGVVKLDLGNQSFSPLPDISFDEEAEDHAKALKELAEELKEEQTFPASYSSDSELSDWGESDEESKVEFFYQMRNLEESRMRQSSSLNDLAKAANVLEEKMKQRDIYWAMQSVKGQNYIDRNVKKLKIFPLTRQSVISNYTNLHMNFGSYWEWKNGCRDETKIISERDVIKEFFWQMSSPDPSNSIIFNPDWSLNSSLMVGSLSKKPFHAFLSKWAYKLKFLSKILKFAHHVTDPLVNKGVPSALRCYGKGILNLHTNFTSTIIELEQSFEIEYIEYFNFYEGRDKFKSHPHCHTLSQVELRLGQVFNKLNLLERLHSQGVRDGDSPSFATLRLLATIEERFHLEGRKEDQAVCIYLYTLTLNGFLDELGELLRNLDWKNNSLFFKRKEEMGVSDLNYWTDGITIENYEKDLFFNISAPTWLHNIVPHLLTLLKTVEILKEENKEEIPSLRQSTKILELFLSNYYSNYSSNLDSSLSAEFSQLQILDDFDELEAHFDYVGLLDEHCFVRGAFSSTAFAKSEPVKKKWWEVEDFLSLSEFPLLFPPFAFGRILETEVSFLAEAGKRGMRDLFILHRVEESMRIVREIVFGSREHFSKSVFALTSKYERKHIPDIEGIVSLGYQKLLNDSYPEEEREGFVVRLEMKGTSFHLNLLPHFPLNMILSPPVIESYLFVAGQIERIRRCVWLLNDLPIKRVVVEKGTPENRVLIFRFSLLQFCSSLRLYIMLKVFTKDLSLDFGAKDTLDLDAILKDHSAYLNSIETKLLRCKVIDKIVISKITELSHGLCNNWFKGTTEKNLISMESTLLKCWNIMVEFSRDIYSPEFNELSQYFGPPPDHLRSY